MKNNEKKERLIQLVNPKNLQQEIHKYGYHFSLTNHILLIAISLMGCLGIAMIYQLKIQFTAILLFILFLHIPIFILQTYKVMYEQKRFDDVAEYVEQMLSAFKKDKKVLTSLKNSLDTFNERADNGSLMHMSIVEAMSYIKKGNVSDFKRGNLREALDIIEENFPSANLTQTHEFMCNVEKYGGEIDNTLNVLLKKNSMWRKRGYELQSSKKIIQIDNLLSIIFASFLTIAILYCLQYMRYVVGMVSHMENPFLTTPIQWTSCIFLIGCVFLFGKNLKKMTQDWLDTEKIYTEKILLNSYETVENWNEKKEVKKSVFLALPFLVGIIPVYILGFRWICILLLLIAIFMLSQHKIGYSIAKKTIINEVNIEFPNWLMNMAMLMENNNVNVSIQKSLEGVGFILKIELKALLDRLDKDPQKVSSYTKTLSKYDIGEVENAMKIFYNAEKNGIVDVPYLINDLLEQINTMESNAKKILHDNLKTKGKMLFFYPIGLCTVKIFIDLLIGFLLSTQGIMQLVK